MMLGYYRNNLIHHFINEAYVALALLGFEKQRGSDSVGLDELFDKTLFLVSILKDEFMIKD